MSTSLLAKKDKKEKKTPDMKEKDKKEKGKKEKKTPDKKEKDKKEKGKKTKKDKKEKDKKEKGKKTPDKKEKDKKTKKDKKEKDGNDDEKPCNLCGEYFIFFFDDEEICSECDLNPHGYPWCYQDGMSCGNDLCSGDPNDNGENLCDMCKFVFSTCEGCGMGRGDGYYYNKDYLLE